MELNNFVCVGEIVRKRNFYTDYHFEEMIHEISIKCNDDTFDVRVDENHYNKLEENDTIGIKATLKSENGRVRINAYKVYKI